MATPTDTTIQENEDNARQAERIRIVELDADVVAAYYKRLTKDGVPADTAHFLVLQRFPAQ